MPNNVSRSITEIEEDYDDEDDYSPDDYGFIVGPDGELKSIMFPEHLMEDPPEEIQLILKIFGIDDINSLDDKNLH